MASDAELIGRSLAGDGEAFIEVISRHPEVVLPVDAVGQGTERPQRTLKLPHTA